MISARSQHLRGVELSLGSRGHRLQGRTQTRLPADPAPEAGSAEAQGGQPQGTFPDEQNGERAADGHQDQARSAEPALPRMLLAAAPSPSPPVARVRGRWNDPENNSTCPRGLASLQLGSKSA